MEESLVIACLHFFCSYTDGNVMASCAGHLINYIYCFYEKNVNKIRIIYPGSFDIV